MKTILSTTLLSATLALSAQANSGLYYVPNDTEESIPITWSVGMNAVWDDNTTPLAGAADDDQTFSLNPFVGFSFVRVTPQTTLDVYARLGVIYYIDKPEAVGADDVFGQTRAGVNLTHRFSERLRFVSRNFFSYELEPDYSTGFATNRQIGEYSYYSSDNALGFRWTERFGTYTGVSFNGLSYDDLADNDRSTWTLYNQFRYQLSPQTVATASVRYSQTQGDGLARDSSNQFYLIGIEHRFSPNTIAIVNAGVQLRKTDGIGGNDATSPYLELTLRSQVNQQFSIRGFARYGIEAFDTVQFVGGLPAEFDGRLTLRVGVTAEYQISPKLAIFGGVDVVSTSFEEGRRTTAPFASVGDFDETLLNAYIGTSLKITEYLYGTFSLNHTTSNSDFAFRDYDRNRVSLGLRAEF